MLQTLPLPVAPGPERPPAAAPESGETTMPGAFAQALRQARREDAEAPAENAADDSVPHTPRVARQRTNPAQTKHARADHVECAAVSALIENAAGAAATAASRDASRPATLPQDAVRDIAARPDTEAKPELQNATAQTVSVIAASDVPAAVPAAPAVRPNAPQDFEPAADEPPLAFATDIASDRSPAPARSVQLGGGETARVRPNERPVVVDAGVWPLAAPITPQRQSDARATAAVPDPSTAAGAEHGRAMPVDAAAFGGAVPALAFSSAAGAPGAVAQAGAHVPATPAQATLTSSVESRDFAPAIGAQVALWIRDGVQEARLHLHPAELGPVSVQIALDGTTARVDFHAQHALTRAAIEESLPALAVALRDSGMTLTGGGVFGQSAGGQDPRSPGDAPERGNAAKPTAASGAAVLDRPAPRSWRSGLLDVFA